MDLERVRTCAWLSHAVHAASPELATKLLKHGDASIAGTTPHVPVEVFGLRMCKTPPIRGFLQKYLLAGSTTKKEVFVACMGAWDKSEDSPCWDKDGEMLERVQVVFTRNLFQGNMKGGLKFHSGFGEHIRGLPMPMFQQFLLQGWQVTFTGHCTGGATAAIMAASMLHASPNSNVHCIAFGSPHVASAEAQVFFANAGGGLKERLKFFCLADDPVPYLYNTLLGRTHSKKAGGEMEQCYDKVKAKPARAIFHKTEHAHIDRAALWSLVEFLKTSFVPGEKAYVAEVCLFPLGQLYWLPEHGTAAVNQWQFPKLSSFLDFDDTGKRAVEQFCQLPNTTLQVHSIKTYISRLQGNIASLAPVLPPGTAEGQQSRSLLPSQDLQLDYEHVFECKAVIQCDQSSSREQPSANSAHYQGSLSGLQQQGNRSIEVLAVTVQSNLQSGFHRVSVDLAGSAVFSTVRTTSKVLASTTELSQGAREYACTGEFCFCSISLPPAASPALRITARVEAMFRTPTGRTLQRLTIHLEGDFNDTSVVVPKGSVCRIDLDNNIRYGFKDQSLAELYYKAHAYSLFFGNDRFAASEELRWSNDRVKDCWRALQHVMQSVPKKEGLRVAGRQHVEQKALDACNDLLHAVQCLNIVTRLRASSQQAGQSSSALETLQQHDLGKWQEAVRALQLSTRQSFHTNIGQCVEVAKPFVAGMGAAAAIGLMLAGVGVATGSSIASVCARVGAVSVGYMSLSGKAPEDKLYLELLRKLCGAILPETELSGLKTAYHLEEEICRLLGAVHAQSWESVWAALPCSKWQGLWESLSDESKEHFARQVWVITQNRVIRNIMSGKRTVGVVGRGKSGKSMLVKKVFGAATQPHGAVRTLDITVYPINATLDVVDFPHFESESEMLSLSVLRNRCLLDMIIVVLPATCQGDDEAVVEWLKGLELNKIPHLVCFNKVDEVLREELCDEQDRNEGDAEPAAQRLREQWTHWNKNIDDFCGRLQIGNDKAVALALNPWVPVTTINRKLTPPPTTNFSRRLRTVRDGEHLLTDICHTLAQNPIFIQNIEKLQQDIANNKRGLMNGGRRATYS